LYDHYLKGRYFYNKREENLILGAEQFEMIIDENPGFAPAYAGLAQCYTLMGFYKFESPESIYPKAKRAAEQAIRINGSLVEAHTALAFINMLYYWNWEAAKSEFLIALKLNPKYPTVHHWYAEYLIAVDNLEEARKQAFEARNYDPLGLIINTLIVMIFYFTGRYDEAIEEGNKILRMNPNYIPVYYWLGLSYAMNGMGQEAISTFKNGLYKYPDNMGLKSLLAYSFAVSHNFRKANDILDELLSARKSFYVSAFDIARIYIGLNDHDKALSWLSTAYQEKSTGLVWLRSDPIFSRVKSYSEITKILVQMNLQGNQ